MTIMLIISAMLNILAGFGMNQADIMWFAVTTALALLVTVVFGGAK